LGAETVAAEAEAESSVTFDPLEDGAGLVLKTASGAEDAALLSAPIAAASSNNNGGLHIPSLNVIPSTPVRSRSPVQSGSGHRTSLYPINVKRCSSFQLPLFHVLFLYS
jgi:hypothetical protein